MSELDQVYTERAIAAVLAAKLALRSGLQAGVGTDQDEMWKADSRWQVVLFVELPGGGQISWHMAHCSC